MDKRTMPRTILKSIEHGMQLVGNSDISVDDALDIAVYIVSTVGETSIRERNERVMLAAATVVTELIGARNA